MEYMMMREGGLMRKEVAERREGRREGDSGGFDDTMVNAVAVAETVVDEEVEVTEEEKEEEEDEGGIMFKHRVCSSGLRGGGEVEVLSKKGCSC